MMWTLFIAAIAIWVLQTALTLWQFRRFNRRLKELRQSGPVAIGKAKGRFLAGAIVLLCIDADCCIVKGEIMEGVTVFAKCRPFSALNGLNLLDMPSAYHPIATGIVILIALIMNQGSSLSDLFKKMFSRPKAAAGK
mgnify:CR=1 FL=1